jgi:hypothetical protein
MLFNIGDEKTKLLLSLAKTPLLFYPHYQYHLPLPSVLMIEWTLVQCLAAKRHRTPDTGESDG